MTRTTANQSVAILTAAALAAVAATALSSTASAATALVPHQAFYKIKLQTAEAGSNISTAQGVMSQEWTQSCEGWAVSQRMLLNLESSNGAAVSTEVTFSSFEAADGSDYSFTSRTVTNGETTEEYRGRAQRPRPGGPVEATYNVPAGESRMLPGNTVFPMEHTRQLLAAAANGETRLSRPFFDGPRPQDSPFEANALILGAARPGDQGSGAGLGPITERPWWPIRVAFFPGGSQSPEPDFELAADFQDNGVVRAYLFDYGDFVLEAELASIEPLELPNCRN